MTAELPTPETMDFGGLTIAFDDRVLRPRPWTAAQSLWAGEHLPSLPPGDVLELCSGAGHIGLLAVHGSGRTLVAAEKNPEACALIRRNAAANGVSVQVREGDLATALEEGELFGLIIADPPWVPRQDTTKFPEDPLLAIDGGPDGLDLARLCIGVIAAHLAPGGYALLQLGNDEQVQDLAGDLADAGLAPLDRLRYADRGVVVRLGHR